MYKYVNSQSCWKNWTVMDPKPDALVVRECLLNLYCSAVMEKPIVL